MSCPYTPQQNGLAERKHRHLIELGLTMLFNSNIPLKYWVEAFYTANYLINLLPSSVLHQKSPYEVMFHTSPVYTSLRIFGCACYPYLRPYAANKFAPRSSLCIFLGYNAQYKGYCCLHLGTGKGFISRHVIFDEACFPFKPSHSNQTPLYSASDLSQWNQILPDASVLPQVSPSQSSSAAPRHMFVPPVGVSSDVSTTLEKQCIECTTGLEPCSIGDITVSSPSRTDTSDTSSPNDSSGLQSIESSTSSADSIVPVSNYHPMITRAKAGVSKPNPRYVLLYQ